MSNPGQEFDLERISSGLAFGPAHQQVQQNLGQGLELPQVIEAPPGSGKTTIVPPAVANALAAQGLHGRIIVTQPRRMAARAAARRLASLDKTSVGERIGFSVRGEQATSQATRIEFVTAGLLLRRLLNDPDLPAVSAVIVDEVHERSIETDLVLAMLNQVSQLREDFALLVMSATLHARELADYLARDIPARIISGSGIQHPVTEEFAPFTATRNGEHGLERDYLRHIAQTAVRHTRANTADGVVHDTLVFVPGAGEVDRVCEMIGADGRFRAYPLHARIPAWEQDLALGQPKEDEPPRIIVATSVAESSLTVPRVNLVIDSGYAREPRRDAVRGMSGLVTVVASRASATQRAGRAGRLGPGKVVRTLDARSYAAAAAFITPEIATADLVQTALYLAAWGTPRADGLQLWQSPPPAAMDDAEQVLRVLGAIGPSGQLTAAGRALVQIPADPRIGRALLEGARRFGTRASAEVVALLSSAERANAADAADLLRRLRSRAHPGHQSWANERRRYERLASTVAPARQDTEQALAGVMALAYPQWVGYRVAPDEYLLASGTRATLPRDSTLGHHEFLAIGDVGRTGHRAVIRLAAGIDRQVVLELLPELHELSERADFREGKVSARRVETLGAIELASTPIRADAALSRQAVHDALEREGLRIFGSQPGFGQLRARLALAHRELGAPFTAMDEACLIASSGQWLDAELRALAEGKRAEKIDLAAALRRLIPWQHAHDFDTLVPERLQVPSGSRIRIRYPEVCEESGRVVVAVKLQECFGLAESPRLLGGRVPVQFHLLSPAGRPLAVTDDLNSFWNGPYTQVRSEMRGRYPKHPWPENPWEHVATAKTTKRLG
ncbi:ATP-dependent helicase HrpB [Glutamicibacter sp. MNS18]|uniref:ATP-dependent helicase HrpB n=1 Tax=Glutamicibacter sp. MNS18 TaxID=2989817 RepID=UPI0022364851|nr:ATP-dependent helicase HrpB [Glutamicibacter sp. MNS18]MCW4467158.1 ATP-dependent helicase HrpB [Glutamicibacter sp. MNS18]